VVQAESGLEGYVEADRENWNTAEPCPGWRKQPFNIDAKLNGAYIALGLLYGSGDFLEDARDFH
jgi:hypothetical protein